MNIYLSLQKVVRENVNRQALIFPRGKKIDSWTFQELDHAINSYSHFFHNQGIRKGDKVLLFIKPGLKFPAITFALFKMGAIPILIDPGMGKTNLLAAIYQVKPQAMIAESVVFILRHFYPQYFSSIKISLSMGSKFLAQESLCNLPLNNTQPSSTFDASENELAAILFTSGGTGIPKGVVYTHQILETQRQTLQKMFSLSSSDIDLPCFPLFALFTLSMGMTSCIPEMNPSKPSSVIPQKIIDNISQFNPTFLAGSPAIWEKVGEFCMKNNIQLPSVKYLVMFGAPVGLKLHQMFSKILPNGTTYTPYGATESLPVSNISGKDVLNHTASLTLQGKGTCVGFPIEGSEVLIYEDSEIPEPFLIGTKIKKAFEIGEILVKGKIATKEYYEMPEQTKLHKIYDQDGFWHRIGDLGYLDYEGRLWFYGRKSHKIMTPQGPLYPIPVEAIFNQHPLIKRTALVGLGKVGNQIPAVVIERSDHFMSLTSESQKRFKQELMLLGEKFPHTKDINHFFLYDYFPVDVRHNIKIDRLKLKVWADAHLDKKL
jgi:acyl-CoA synthetase (AMP-forming)/AMP-acid ligase II